MNRFLLVALFAGLTLTACQQAEKVLPNKPVEAEAETCHLFSKAVVSYFESEEESFYYLTLLDTKGEKSGTVYTSSLQGINIEAGDYVDIYFHYLSTGAHISKSDCEKENDDKELPAGMKLVSICEMIDNS